MTRAEIELLRSLCNAARIRFQEARAATETALDKQNEAGVEFASINFLLSSAEGRLEKPRVGELDESLIGDIPKKTLAHKKPRKKSRG